MCCWGSITEAGRLARRHSTDLGAATRTQTHSADTRHTGEMETRGTRAAEEEQETRNGSIDRISSQAKVFLVPRSRTSAETDKIQRNALKIDYKLTFNCVMSLIGT